MRTTISRRKSRTRPSCICERVTCLGRTRVMRLPDSAKCRRFVDVATDMYDTHVSDAQVRECWSHDIVRNELSLLPLSWRPSGLPKSREVWFMREHEIEKAQLQEEASWRMDRKVLWTTHAEKETKEKKWSNLLHVDASQMFSCMCSNTPAIMTLMFSEVYAEVLPWQLFMQLGNVY